MKVLFAVSNEEISESIVKRYQKEYKEIISYKNVYYFNAILKEIQKDKTYDRIVISEDLEAFTHTQYDQIDKFIFDKLDSISDEASNIRGNDTPVILICSDRRGKSEQMLVKLFGIGIYNALIGNDRSVEQVCKLIHRPRLKKEAKSYYKIDSEEVNYQSESENDVSEMEIQNILAHYKSLGKNEDRYIDSFNNIAAQYNDTQLRIISKFLPLNVRAVLEEKSRKYQQVMSFNNSVSDNLRKTKKEQENDGPSEKLLKPKNRDTIITKPVVIPSTVNISDARKLTKQKNIAQVQNSKTIQKTQIVQSSKTTQGTKINSDSQTPKSIQKEFIEDIKNEREKRQEEIEQKQVQNNEGEQKKRGRGRPRKNPPKEENVTEPTTVKRKRGRPRKNPIPEYEQEKEVILPGLEDDEKEDLENNILPGFDSDNQEIYEERVEEKYEAPIIPGFEEDELEDSNIVQLPGFNEEDNKTILPGLETEEDNETILPGLDIREDNNVQLPGLESEIQNNDIYEQQNHYIENRKQNYVETINISSLLTGDKKIVSFVGTSKNGTSFIVNNIAELLSSIGINTAVLDTTTNRNSYYIYTKNEEELRKTASLSLENLIQGEARGIQVNKNLTVYTSLPDADDIINNVDNILETLIKNHSLILIDSDFNTPIGYFKQSQEIYLVQSMDILTIQPLTAFLRDLKARNILEEKKLKIVLNKYMKLKGVTPKTIIGGMAFYNDPAMSYMTELFDRNLIKYITIPFDEEIYVKYLEGLINCDINLKGYSKNFIQILKELGNMVYPLISGQGTYRPPSVSNNTGFSPSINNTLDQMKRKY